MNCISQVRSYTTAVFRRTSCVFARSDLHQCRGPIWKTRFDVKTTDLEFVRSRFQVHCFSSKKRPGRKTTRSAKLEAKSAVEKENDAFYVVRKGDMVGIYKNLNDCQAQIRSSVCDPPMSVFKGYSLPKDAEEHLVSHGLKNAVYSMKAADLKEDMFGALMPCPFQDPTSSKDETVDKDSLQKSPEVLLEKESGHSCIIEFDGASKGNPGKAGAAAVLRTLDRRVICKLREGVGIATCNAAEYRGIILGLRYALEKGYKDIFVQGDSKLVCMQMQDLWQVKNENMSVLNKEAKKYKDKFSSVKISHVLRKFNSDADEQANLAVLLAEGQVEVALD